MLFKVQPLIDRVREHLLQLPVENNLAIDEQIIPIKGNFFAKQYNQGKSCPVIVTRWNDNKVVNLASNFVGFGKTDKTTRWDKASQTRLEIDRPEVVRLFKRKLYWVNVNE